MAEPTQATIPFNARINGMDVRVFYSSSDLAKYPAQEKEWAYLIDTKQIGPYLNGAWHFYRSEVQVLQDLRSLWDGEAPEFYASENAKVLDALSELNALLTDLRTELRDQNTAIPLAVTIPGIGTDPYTSGDAFGGKFRIDVPWTSLTIVNAWLHDYDDEGLPVEVVLFREDFTGIADNAAFDLTDNDNAKVVGVINIDLFYNYGQNQIGNANPALLLPTPERVLRGQCVVRGAPTIAAGREPKLTLMVTR